MNNSKLPPPPRVPAVDLDSPELTCPQAYNAFARRWARAVATTAATVVATTVVAAGCAAGVDPAPRELVDTPPLIETSESLPFEQWREVIDYGLETFATPECRHPTVQLHGDVKPCNPPGRGRTVGVTCARAYNHGGLSTIYMVWADPERARSEVIETLVHEALHVALHCEGIDSSDHDQPEWRSVAEVAKGWVQR